MSHTPTSHCTKLLQYERKWILQMANVVRNEGCEIISFFHSRNDLPNGTSVSLRGQKPGPSPTLLENFIEGLVGRVLWGLPLADLNEEVRGEATGSEVGSRGSRSCNSE